MINDECRATHQSDFAKKGTFKRQFGATKDFSKNHGSGDQNRKKGQHPRKNNDFSRNKGNQKQRFKKD
jgi:hypothetical protein